MPPGPQDPRERKQAEPGVEGSQSSSGGSGGVPLLGAIWSGLKGAGRWIWDKAGGLGAGAAAGALLSRGGRHLVERVTGLGEAESGQKGRELSSFMDAAYPGTTPWERLGATGAGAAVSSDASRDIAKQQVRLQDAISRRQVAQMERQSRRQATVQDRASSRAAAAQVRSSSQNAWGQFGSELLRQWPEARGPATQLMRQATGQDVRLPHVSTRVNAGGEHIPGPDHMSSRAIAQLRATTERDRVSADVALRQARLELDEFRTAFDQLMRREGQSALAREWIGISKALDDALAGVIGTRGQVPANRPASAVSQLLSAVAAGRAGPKVSMALRSYLTRFLNSRRR